MCVRPPAAHAGLRAEEHDAPEPRFEHHARRFPHAQEGAGKVDVDRVLPGLQRHVLHQRVGEDARARDEVVEAPVRFHAPLYHRPHGRFAAHVDDVADGLHALFPELINGPVHGVPGRVGDQHFRAALPELDRRLAPQSSRAARDDRGAVLHFCVYYRHVPSAFL